MSRLKTLTDEYRELRVRLELGGGPEKVRRQHEQGKLTARERIIALLDRDAERLENGLRVASDQYDGQAPAAAVVTGLGRIAGVAVPNLVKSATRQPVAQESPAAAAMHTTVSAVAHCRAKDDADCLAHIREYVARLPRSLRPPAGNGKPKRSAKELYELLPSDHRMSYDVRAVLECVLDAGKLDEFQPDVAPEMICGHSAIEGRAVAVIANSRGVIKGKQGESPKIGGIIYTESAEKVAYFIDNADRERIPLLFVQDVSGFMVGTEAEHSGIIRAGARFVEAMATATVPKLVLTVNHASGAGYYAMAGQGFDPDFIVSWPTGRM